jgi:hypothetical protein
MYHAWILDDLLDIQHLFESYPPDSPECALEVSECIERVGCYLNQIIHPDWRDSALQRLSVGCNPANPPDPFGGGRTREIVAEWYRGKRHV